MSTAHTHTHIHTLTFTLTLKNQPTNRPIQYKKPPILFSTMATSHPITSMLTQYREVIVRMQEEQDKLLQDISIIQSQLEELNRKKRRLERTKTQQQIIQLASNFERATITTTTQSIQLQQTSLVLLPFQQQQHHHQQHHQHIQSQQHPQSQQHQQLQRLLDQQTRQQHNRPYYQQQQQQQKYQQICKRRGARL